MAPGDAMSALAFSPSGSTKLLVSSWDTKVYLYDIANGSEGNHLINTYKHRASVLDVCFGANDDEAFSAGVDFVTNRINLQTGERTPMSTHTAPVRCVVYDQKRSILVSASWDSTLHIHDLSDPSKEYVTVQLPQKPHGLSLSPSKVVVAMAGRILHIYDLDAMKAVFASGEKSLSPWQQRESSLRFLMRTVACLPNDTGYATSSIEGRVAVDFFDDSEETQARNYAFKCHRQPAPDGDGDLVYPVNALAFHPVHGTFASGGGDGTVAFWDAVAKRRLKQYQKFPQSVAALAFSSDGKFLAVGVCPGFETGMTDYNGEGKSFILVRELGENEAKGKSSK